MFNKGWNSLFLECVTFLAVNKFCHAFLVTQRVFLTGVEGVFSNLNKMYPINITRRLDLQYHGHVRIHLAKLPSYLFLDQSVKLAHDRPWMFIQSPT